MNNAPRLPITLISGPLGSGKTTLLRHLVESLDEKMAIIMNEFGELAIDSRVVRGRNVEMTELGGGCVCCSLIGEFEAAVREIVERVDPERIVVETTGLAEPEALVWDIEESLPELRLDGVVVVADADAFVRFQSLGHTTRVQLESADLILLNKVDLVSLGETDMVERKLKEFNSRAPILRTRHAQVDIQVLLGLSHRSSPKKLRHDHIIDFQSFPVTLDSKLDRACFENVVERIDERIYRAKGFVIFSDGSYLFNFVAGRWSLEPFAAEETALAFIGPKAREVEASIREAISGCTREL